MSLHTLAGARVLVTGAAGFLGANLVRALLEDGAEVHGLVRRGTSSWRLAGLTGELALHAADLTDVEGLGGAVAAARPEVVFHTAAAGGHPASRSERETALRVSVLGTANLLEELRWNEVGRFVHVGSSLEYGPKPGPVTEADVLEPATFRGAVKAAATLLCLQLAHAAARPVTVLRPLSVYGPWEQPSRLVPSAVRAARYGEPLPLTARGAGRDFVFVDDVVEACLLVARAGGEVDGEIVNIGSGIRTSNEELVAAVERITGRRIVTLPGRYPSSPPDTGTWLADVTKARELLDWTPRHTLDQGLAETVEWFRAREEAGDAVPVA